MDQNRLLISGWCSTGLLVIPDELTSLLSLAYSNIPPIKKGTDSRVGFGFAFGNHADVQVMFELGPQTNTNPIGQTFPTNSKRQASPPAKVNKNREKFLQSDAGKYLANWAQKMKNPIPAARPEEIARKPMPGEVPNLEDSVVELVKNNKGQYEIHQPSPTNIPSKAFLQLKKLYGGDAKTDSNKDEIRPEIDNNDTERSAEEVRKITEDLSNVDLD